MFFVNFSEISIKGKNQKNFINTLRGNILRFLQNENLNSVRIENHFAYFIIKNFEDKDREKVKQILKNTIGITQIYDCLEIEKDLNLVLEKIKELKLNDFRFEVKREDKKFHLISPQIRDFILNNLDDNIDFSKDAKQKIMLRVRKDNFLFLYNKIDGLKGLPVGSGGKLVSLISSGIDSPVSSFLMMRKGCKLILLNFFKSEEDKLKVEELFEVLKKFDDNLKIIFVDWNKRFEFFNKFKRNSIEDRYKCIICKNSMFLYAQELAKEKGAGGIVTGDSLGQVASQTLENIYACRDNVFLPFFSPLIGFTKEEIIEIANKISTYDISVRKIKEKKCEPANPITKASIEKFRKINTFE